MPETSSGQFQLQIAGWLEGGSSSRSSSGSDISDEMIQVLSAVAGILLLFFGGGPLQVHFNRSMTYICVLFYPRRSGRSSSSSDSRLPNASIRQ